MLVPQAPPGVLADPYAGVALNEVRLVSAGPEAPAKLRIVTAKIDCRKSDNRSRRRDYLGSSKRGT